MKRIGRAAFYRCDLRMIHIPDRVEHLCDKCFFMCRSLSHAIVGESSSLKKIGLEVFSGSALASFSLPSNVVSVDRASFSECPMREFVISATNSSFSFASGLLLSKDGRLCYGCVGRLKEVVIPDQAEELCDKCFLRCTSFSRLRLSELSLLKMIGVSAFYAFGLKEIQAPVSPEGILRKAIPHAKTQIIESSSGIA